MSFSYSYKTSPFPHQAKIFKESVLRESVSLILEPGLGKSKIIIDQASCLFQLGKIDTLVVVAPNGVHRMWVSDEIPLHMPEEVQAVSKQLVYYSAKSKNKGFQKEQEELLKHKGLSILVVSYEACITDAFKKWFKKFLTTRKAMLVLDESHRIKGATSKIKTTLVAMGSYARYRRILTGTPCDKVTDVYSQIRFLDKDFWKSKGFPTKTEFDNFFCITEDRQFGQNRFKHVVGYRNVEQLSDWVAETGYRMTLSDAGIELPPLLQSKRYHAITGEQKRVYDELKDECRTVLASGDELTTTMAVTKLLRLQQVICGYVATESEQPVQRINPDGKNPRLEVAVDDILKELPHQAIVWSRFTEDINQLMDALGKDAVRYDGKVDDEGRARAKQAFQSGDVKYIVMSSAGAEGLTLTGAKTMLMYANDFKSIIYSQKIGRMFRIGQKDHTHVIDLVCEGTVDEHIIKALRDKKEISDIIRGAKKLALEEFL